MAIGKLWKSYKPVADVNVYVGSVGEIFYDSMAGELRISNGETPRGLPVSGTVSVANKLALDSDTISALTQTTTIDNFPIDSLQIALGQIPGYSLGDKFGENKNIGTGQIEDCWTAGGLYTGFVQETEAITVTSDNAGDAGYQLVVYGLDAAGLEIQETVTLSGGSPSATTISQFNRCFRLRISPGHTTSNVGTITATHATTTANVFATITPGDNTSQVCAFTVPSNKRYYLKRWVFGIARANGSGGSAEVSMMRCVGTGSLVKFMPTYVNTASVVDKEIEGHIILEPGTNMVVRISDVSDGGTRLSSAVYWIEETIS